MRELHSGNRKSRSESDLSIVGVLTRVKPPAALEPVHPTWMDPNERNLAYMIFAPRWYNYLRRISQTSCTAAWKVFGHGPVKQNNLFHHCRGNE